MASIIHIISAVYKFLWGDLITLPLPGGGAVGKGGDAGDPGKGGHAALGQGIGKTVGMAVDEHLISSATGRLRFRRESHDRI